MKIEESSSSKLRRQSVILANLALTGFIFSTHRRLSSRQRLLSVAAWVICRGAFLHGVMCPNSAIFGPVIRRFQPQGRKVWLTLDDGPDPRSTPALLDLLGEYEAPASFFVIGRQVDRHPELVQAMAEGGHQVGNHTHTHPSTSMWASLPSRLHREVRMGSAAVKRASGIAPSFFRAPAGISSPLLHGILAAYGLSRVGWSARGFDGFDRFSGRSVERMLKAIRPGAIILFHGEGRSASTGPQRLRQLLERLTNEGYRCVLPYA